MNRGPQPGGASAVAFVAKAQSAWGDAMPEEIRILAEECERSSASAAARAIGYSSGVVSLIIAKRYRGDTRAVFTKIRGALLRETVICPVLDVIGKDRCLAEQKRPFSPTNSTRARLWHACQTCEHRHRSSSEEAQDEQAV